MTALARYNFAASGARRVADIEPTGRPVPPSPRMPGSPARTPVILSSWSPPTLSPMAMISPMSSPRARRVIPAASHVFHRTELRHVPL